MALRKNWPLMAGRLLKLSKVVDKRLWDWEHPLRQFVFLPADVLNKIEERGLSVDRLRDMDSKDIGISLCFNCKSFYVYIVLLTKCDMTVWVMDV